MRKYRMWYGLVIIWTTRYVKMVIRKTGERMKMYARRLEHFGDDITPRWSRELFHKCDLSDAEVHIGSNVFIGKVDSIYQEYSGSKDSFLVIKFKAGIKRNSISLIPEASEGHVFKLAGYGPPVVIKENGFDCIWTGHKNGYIVIFLG